MQLEWELCKEACSGSRSINAKGCQATQTKTNHPVQSVLVLTESQRVE